MQHDSVSVRVFYRDTVPVPIGIVRSDDRSAGGYYSSLGLDPIALVEIEDDEVFVRGFVFGGCALLSGEFEVHRIAGLAKHYTIESVMVFEFRENVEPENVTVECHDFVEAIRRTSDSHVLDYHLLCLTYAPVTIWNRSTSI
jgi:hypothetical protein